MKTLKLTVVALFIIIIGCQKGDAGGQTLPPVPPPPPPPPPPHIYEIVKMSDGHEMVRVPAGRFKMGSDTDMADERPMRQVFLDEFLIDRYEASNEEYGKCVKAGRCGPNLKHEGFTMPYQPVGGVSWSQARDYCRWMGERLPTEAEWEMAARGRDGRRYPWGEKPSRKYATYAAKTTSTVDSNPEGVSPFGAFNMAGNAAEWVRDYYDADYYAHAPPENPKGPPTGEFRILRGGSYLNGPDHIRTSYRLWEHPNYQFPGYGVRCAK